PAATPSTPSTRRRPSGCASAGSSRTRPTGFSRGRVPWAVEAHPPRPPSTAVRPNPPEDPSVGHRVAVRIDIDPPVTLPLPREPGRDPLARRPTDPRGVAGRHDGQSGALTTCRPPLA